MQDSNREKVITAHVIPRESGATASLWSSAGLQKPSKIKRKWQHYLGCLSACFIL